MLITIEIDNDLKGQINFPSPFNLDIDPRSTISDLKVTISLNFHDVDPEIYDLLMMPQRTRLINANSLYLNYIQGQTEDHVQVIRLVRR